MGWLSVRAIFGPGHAILKTQAASKRPDHLTQQNDCLMKLGAADVKLGGIFGISETSQLLVSPKSSSRYVAKWDYASALSQPRYAVCSLLERFASSQPSPVMSLSI